MVGASLPSGYVPPLHRCLECGGMNNILASGIAQLVPSAHAPLYELIRGSDR